MLTDYMHAFRNMLIACALFPLVASGQDADGDVSSAERAELPCGAIAIAAGLSDVPRLEDPREAATIVESLRAQYLRCESQLLEDDRKRIAQMQEVARESLEWPRTLEQAVAKIIQGSDRDDKKLVASKKREDLIEFHHGWGTGIRNAMGLWRGNEALLRSACGGRSCHPDDASMKIIEAVWDELQRQQPPVRD